MRRVPLRVLLMIALVLPYLGACGKKGPPVLTRGTIDARIVRLAAEWKNGTVLLQGRIKHLDQVPGEISGCRVYHTRYPVRYAPCASCPIDYPGYVELQGDVIAGERFQCKFPVQKTEGIHFFELRLSDESGALGPPSNRVRLTVP